MRFCSYIQKCGLLLGACILLSGCTGQEPGVNLYTDMDKDAIKPLLAQWQREVGIPIRVTYADSKDVQSGTGLSQRIMEEKGSMKADIYWGRDVAAMQRLVQDGTLAPVSTKFLTMLPTPCREEKGNWFGMGARVRVFLYNKKAFAGKKPPQSFADLAHPEWKGKAAVADPRTNGSSNYHLAVIYTALLETDADPLLDKIKANDVQILPSEKAVVDAVISGKAAWGITDSDLAEAAAQNQPVAYAACDQAEYSTARSMGREDGDIYTIGTPVLSCPVGLLSTRPSNFDGSKLYDIVVSLPSNVLLSRAIPDLIPTVNSLSENPPESRKGRPLNLSKLRISPAKPTEVIKKQTILLLKLNRLFGTTP